MDKMNNSLNKLIVFFVLFVISLFVVFFVKYETYKTRDQFGDITVEKKLVVSMDAYRGFRKGLDVAGGVRLTYKIDFSKYEQVYTNPQDLFKIKKTIKSIIKRNIENRISKLGVSDYSINLLVLNGQDYLQVEIGGIHDLDYAKSVIGKTVELEFKVPYSPGENDEKIVEFRKKLAENFLKKIILSGEEMSQLENIDDGIYYFNGNFSSGELPVGIKEEIKNIVSTERGKVYPKLISGSFKINYPRLSIDKIIPGWFIVKNNGVVGSGKNLAYNLEFLFITRYPFWIPAIDPTTKEVLNGAYFKYATVGQDQLMRPTVDIQFDDKGKKIFCNITKKYLKKPMAIFVGNKLLTSPVIQSEICGGTAQITGQYTPKEAKKLAKELNEGALPAKLILSHEEKIAPVLGEKALMGAIIAGFVGFIAIFLLLIWMYGFKWGLIAIAALLEFIAVVLAIVKITDYALSLSGIAAILLSIGIAVDANILMYERIREELKEGNSYFIALKHGFERSWNAIRDGNLTTLMIALILFMIGMNVFKGFGTMMILNIIITLFIVVPVTRTLLEYFHENK